MTEKMVRKTMVFLLLFFLLFLPMNQISTAEDSVIVTLEPVNQTITVGETINLTVTIDSQSSIGGWELDLITFSSELLQAKQVISGNQWAEFFSNGTIDNQHGVIDRVQSWKTNNYPTGEHVLCIITFTAEKAGTDMITIIDSSITNQDFEDLSVERIPAEITIIDPSSSNNSAPNVPSQPIPSDHATDIPLTQQLSWLGQDLDDDQLTYTVYLDKNNPPTTVVATNITASQFPSEMMAETTYYWQVTCWDEHNEKQSGPIWQFTTQQEVSDGQDSSTPSETPSNPSNNEEKDELVIQDPTAKHNGPYQAMVKENIEFNASTSRKGDYEIGSYHWDFGDTSTSDQEITTHHYSKPGEYTVQLTVTDAQGNKNTVNTTATIQMGNIPPDQPVISGPRFGSINKQYTFSITLADEDDSKLTLTIDWNDQKPVESINNHSVNTIVTQSHVWDKAGKYDVSVSVTDNENTLSKQVKTVYINAYPVENFGYVVDENNDGIFNYFHHNQTDLNTTLTYKQDSYFIDIDDDGTFDYEFSSNLELKSYNQPIMQTETPGFSVIILLCAVIVFLYFKQRQNQ